MCVVEKNELYLLMLYRREDWWEGINTSKVYSWSEAYVSAWPSEEIDCSEWKSKIEWRHSIHFVVLLSFIWVKGPPYYSEGYRFSKLRSVVMLSQNLSKLWEKSLCVSSKYLPARDCDLLRCERFASDRGVSISCSARNVTVVLKFQPLDSCRPTIAWCRCLICSFPFREGRGYK